MEELITADIDKLGDFWARAVYPFVKPIIEADYKGEPSPVASGVLVSLREKRYLLSAGHAISPYLENGSAKGAPYTFVPEQLEIGGLRTSVLEGAFDLSLTEIPVQCRCLQLPAHLGLASPGEMCLFLGFPARERAWKLDLAAHTLRPSPLLYLGQISRTSDGRFGVRFSRKRVYRSGKKLPELGKVNGISGGGVFVLRNDMPKLAGIVIEYRERDSEIMCTGSDVVWEMVKRVVAPTA